MQNLIVTLIQASLEWQNPAANRANFEGIINQVDGSNLILLPEMFTTGFAQESAQLAETMLGDSVQWLLTLAQQKNADIAGSVVIREKENIFNRLLWAKPDGSLYTYDKRHLFSFAGEDKVYCPGKERIIIECNGWRVCPQVCYDLRFPVWSRNRNDYDLLVYVANWPKARINHWSQLLIGRAIENLSYVIGVNRIGEDGSGYAHNGQSIVLDPKGKPLVEPGSKAGAYTVTLDFEELKRYREKFRALQDADEFTIKL